MKNLFYLVLFIFSFVPFESTAQRYIFTDVLVIDGDEVNSIENSTDFATASDSELATRLSIKNFVEEELSNFVTPTTDVFVISSISDTSQISSFKEGDIAFVNSSQFGFRSESSWLFVVNNDNDPNNEIQTLSKTGNIVSLSNGGGSFVLDQGVTGSVGSNQVAFSTDGQSLEGINNFRFFPGDYLGIDSDIRLSFNSQANTSHRYIQFRDTDPTGVNNRDLGGVQWYSADISMDTVDAAITANLASTTGQIRINLSARDFRFYTGLADSKVLNFEFGHSGLMTIAALGTNDFLRSNNGTIEGFSASTYNLSNFNNDLFDNLSTGYIPYFNGTTLLDGVQRVSTSATYSTVTQNPLRTRSVARFEMLSSGTGHLKIEAHNAATYIENESPVPIRFRNSSNEDILILADGGNVGIGTTGPTEKLEISESGEPNLKIRNTSTSKSTGDSYGGVLTEGRINGGSFFTAAYAHSVVNSPNSRLSDYIVETSGPSPGVVTEKFRIKSSGRINYTQYGLGNHNDSPDYILGVKSDGDVVEMPLILENSIYTNNGSLNGPRDIDLNGNRLFFTSVNNGGHLYLDNSQMNCYFTNGTDQGGIRVNTTDTWITCVDGAGVGSVRITPTHIEIEDELQIEQGIIYSGKLVDPSVPTIVSTYNPTDWGKHTRVLAPNIVTNVTFQSFATLSDGQRVKFINTTNFNFTFAHNNTSSGTNSSGRLFLPNNLPITIGKYESAEFEYLSDLAGFILVDIVDL